ncbi:MAG: response regulator transcription factor [Candidatus Pristimantibacillus lignocellulolyticus]|uniref:Response regulator transcription factor n=1 Tax=Candidatus Pristimantibacillus lignocellulolyticus TaxID=2994561 RepID=A0A9J6ZF45_9BACL|nr:MAG: response regulator transcription factor [Candidatus Pristimantibacillus lignocellulolyticus]
MYSIMIVEDDPKIAQVLKLKLEQYSYEAIIAHDLKNIMEQFEQIKPHMLLLDINLPYFDGFYWCRQVRKNYNIPIIFISARDGEMDQVMAIENGGDDYITKPVQLELLVAKVRSQLRRAYGEYAINPISSSVMDEGLLSDNDGEIGKIEIEGMTLWLSRNELSYKQKLVDLTKNELLLAECFFTYYGEVVTRDQLLESLWDDIQFVDDNTLTVNMTRLRKKFAELGLPSVIETIRGQGYKLKLV